MTALRNLVAVLWFILLTACAIQLAPSYDQALVDGLSEANAETLTLFAALEQGSPQARFAEFEPRYAQAIGGFDALRQRAATRQVPPLAARLAKSRLVADFCNAGGDPAACVNASPASLGVVLTTLRALRDRHATRGLQPDIVELFRGQYDTAIAQALTVENALRR